MTVAKKIREAMERASWIRRMFEDGARLKQERGEEEVIERALPAFERVLSRWRRAG